MYVRTRQVYLDFNGNPITGAKVYVGLPNTDPRQQANQIPLTEGINGPRLAQPYFTDGNGRPRAINNDKVDPFTTATEYSIEFRGPNDALIDRIAHYTSDAFGLSGSGSVTGEAIVDGIFDDFATAKAADLTEFDTIYVRSYAGTWQGTASGPTGDFFAYRTGSIPLTSAETPGDFTDSQGNGWKPFESQRLYAEMFGAIAGIGNDSFQAIQDMFNAAIDLERPCYLDADDYYIGNQSNDSGTVYSLFNNYALYIPDSIEIYGNGHTTIHNSNANSNQYIIFAEDVELLIIKGLDFDANASTVKDGALFIAGCETIEIESTVRNSGPVYITGSQLTASGDIRFNFVFENSIDYALSGNGAGYSTASGTIQFVDCAKGFDISNNNADGRLYAIPDNVTTLDYVTGNVTGDVFKVVNGSLVFGDCTVEGNISINVEMTTVDVTLIKGDFITGCPIVYESITSTGGTVKNVNIDKVFATDVNFGIVISHAAFSLVEEFVINYLELDGGGSGVAFTIGDINQTGNIRIIQGLIHDFNAGIQVNQTKGQNFYTSGVLWENITSFISAADITELLLALSGGEYYGHVSNPSGIENAVFVGIPPLAWELEEIEDGSEDRVKITHNLGHTNYYPVATCLKDIGVGQDAKIYSISANFFEVICSPTNGIIGADVDFFFHVKSNW